MSAACAPPFGGKFVSYSWLPPPARRSPRAASRRRPARSTAPGVPAIAASVPMARYWNVTWTQGAAGDPEEAYAVKCVLAGQPYTSTAVGSSLAGIPRLGAAPAGWDDDVNGTWIQRATITGLNSEASYSCYVVASNIGGIRPSAPQAVATSAP